MKNALIRHISPGIPALSAMVIALLMILVAFSEIRHGKALIFDLTLDKADLVANQVEQAASLALRANREIENELALRLLAAARTTAKIDPRTLTREYLKTIAGDHDIQFLEIRDSKGKIVLSVHPDQTPTLTSQEDFAAMFADLFQGILDEQILGIHVPRRGGGSRFSVAVKHPMGGFVVAGLDAAEISRFRRSFGLGRLLQDVGGLHDLHYLLIQDMDGILAATEKIGRIGSIPSDPFLLEAWETDRTSARMIPEDPPVFEVVKKIRVDQNVYALLRVALDAKPLIQIEKKAYRRMILTMVGLAILLAAAVNALVIFQNLKVIRRARDEAVSLSDAVLRDMADGVIVTDHAGAIRLINDRAKTMLPSKLPPLPPPIESLIQSAFQSDTPLVREMEIPLDEKNTAHLVVASSKIHTQDAPDSMVVSIIHDVTGERRMEKQARLNEKLIAMGNLAGAVAHEVRNPLNAIGMTAQRLQAEFQPTEDPKGYNALIGIITEEIRRLDDIIGQFLQFARTPVIERTPGSLKESIESVVRELAGVAASRSVRITFEAAENPRLSFDSKQMRQVWLNLTTNAIDACRPDDSVFIRLRDEKESVLVEIEDTGAGMDEETRARVFDLYFTTKDRGTGLGLPIALRILHAHDGNLELESAPGQGTRIRVRLKKE